MSWFYSASQRCQGLLHRTNIVFFLLKYLYSLLFEWFPTLSPSQFDDLGHKLKETHQLQDFVGSPNGYITDVAQRPIADIVRPQSWPHPHSVWWPTWSCARPSQLRHICALYPSVKNSSLNSVNFLFCHRIQCTIRRPSRWITFFSLNSVTFLTLIFLFL